MSNVRQINNILPACPAELYFPIGKPFKIEDQFNGPQRGTWFYRSKITNRVYGPFLTWNQTVAGMVSE